ncbi:MAG: DUF4384 domain-containing protein [Gammaproteobacteria bacterium]|nr:DUF4384 domain-containing protein [Gammaproteobacteria bacterium]
MNLQSRFWLPLLLLGLLPPAWGASRPAEVLRDIHARRDTGQSVRVEGAPDRVRIGRDSLRFTVTTDRDGYLYVLMAGSDGRQLTQLLPNAEDVDNRIQAGKPLTLPRSTWRFRAAGPAGEDRLLVMLSPEPRDFSHLLTGQSGPFPAIEPHSLRTRGITISQDIAGCAGTTCGYGAALFSVREDP